MVLQEMKKLRRHKKNESTKSVSVTIVEAQWLCYTAEPTQPSSASRATVRSTRPINFSPSTLGHCSVTPVTVPLPPSSAQLRALFCARTVTGKAITFRRRRCTTGGLWKGSVGALV
ncbi:hypothetical protein Pyn_31793 [Prunus yedoensis var. nudiflora]|uniref:Uncharacterized protein n=1 Tax=Prunus yedoensis var. nudiflora TaxID=2094558 RepID=A0A314UCH0_PRUYE|nr:hypothetical protein Pyn_31793 [Prunus yedoensis var. nudiflora]